MFSRIPEYESTPLRAIQKSISAADIGKKTVKTEKMTETVRTVKADKRMKKGTVKFQYIKKDGSVRTAVGTLRSDLITQKPAGGECYPRRQGYTPYFDIEKGWWRVFAESKLSGVVEE